MENASQVRRASGNKSFLGPRGARVIPIMGAESGPYIRWSGADGVAGQQGAGGHVQQGERVDRRGKARQIKQALRMVSAGIFLFMVGAGAFVISHKMIAILHRL